VGGVRLWGKNGKAGIGFLTIKMVRSLGTCVERPLMPTHHLAQTVDDDELAVRIARDDQMETVGAEVYRGKDVGDRASRRLRVGLLAVADGADRTHATLTGIRRRRRSRSRRWSRRWGCG